MRRTSLGSDRDCALPKKRCFPSTCNFLIASRKTADWAGIGLLRILLLRKTASKQNFGRAVPSEFFPSPHAIFSPDYGLLPQPQSLLKPFYDDTWDRLLYAPIPSSAL